MFGHKHAISDGRVYLSLKLGTKKKKNLKLENRVMVGDCCFVKNKKKFMLICNNLSLPIKNLSSSFCHGMCFQSKPLVQESKNLEPFISFHLF